MAGRSCSTSRQSVCDMHGLSNTTSGVFARRRRLCRPESAARRPFHVEGLGQLAGCCACARPYRYAGAIAGGVLSRAYLRPRRTARCDLMSSSMGVKNRVAPQRDSGSGDGGELAGDNVAEKDGERGDGSGVAAPSSRDWTAFDSAQTLMQLLLFVLPLGFGGVSIYGELLGVSISDMDSGTKAIGSCSSQALQLAGTVWIMSRLPSQERPTASSISPAVLRNGVVGGAVAVLLVGAVVAALSTGSVSDGGGEAAMAPVLSSTSSLTPTTAALLALQTVVMGPVTEELIYRGLLLNQLLRVLATPSAVCLSAALFSGAHFSPDEFAAVFALGVVLGGVYIYNGRNLTSSVIAHAVYNAFALTMLATRGGIP